MDNSINDMIQPQEDIDQISSYRSLSMTWQNAKELSKAFCTTIENENEFKKIAELESIFLDKLNDIYTELIIDADDLSNKQVGNYIPVIMDIISRTFSVLSSCKYNNSKRKTNTTNFTGEDGLIEKWTIKLKRSTTTTFKIDCAEILEVLIDILKSDISLNKRLVTFGMPTREQIENYTVKLIKNGGIEIHKKRK